jgi:hypothetical protein
MTTAKPSRASRKAAARPMPREAPVTIACFGARLGAMSFIRISPILGVRRSIQGKRKPGQR